MNEDHNKELKKAVSDVLKKMSIVVGGVDVPLLTSSTNQILINCNRGEVTDILPEFRIK